MGSITDIQPSSAHSGLDSPTNPTKWYGTPPSLHRLAWICAILGTIGAFSPGRGSRAKIVAQNSLSTGSALWGINQLSFDYRGKSLIQRTEERLGSLLTLGDPLPDKAQRTKALIETERTRRAVSEREREELRRRKLQREREERGILMSVWMGNETTGWKEKRLEEERKALESGKSHWDLIVEQIRDVCTQSWKKTNQDEAGEAHFRALDVDSKVEAQTKDGNPQQKRQ